MSLQGCDVRYNQVIMTPVITASIHKRRVNSKIGFSNASLSDAPHSTDSRPDQPATRDHIIGDS
jgi:hypothetical protein